MGTLIIKSTGQLYLNGVTSTIYTYVLNTMEVDVESGGSIYFDRKGVLRLLENAILKVRTGGLLGDCNNNNEIWIGAAQPFAICSGAPGYIFTFAEIMAAGGTLDAVIIKSSANEVCLGTAITLQGSYLGSAGTTTQNGSIPGVNYHWVITSDGGYSASATTQNTSIPGNSTGIYTVSLTVDTWNETLQYTNTHTTTIVVNPLPQGSLTANGPFCGNGTGQLTWTSTSGIGPFTVAYNDGIADRTVISVQSGVPFNVDINPVILWFQFRMIMVVIVTVVSPVGPLPL
jgi:hypothetical protein